MVAISRGVLGLLGVATLGAMLLALGCTPYEYMSDDGGSASTADPSGEDPCAGSGEDPLVKMYTERWEEALGLDEMDTMVLRTLIEKFEGGPVGLNSLAVAMGEDATTLEEVYEPFLIMEGYLMRTPQGRVATPRAFRRFGYSLPDGQQSPQGTLFVEE